MDTASVTLEPLTAATSGEWVAVHNAVHPNLALTREEFDYDRTLIEEQLQRYWIARVDGEPAAVLGVTQQVWAKTSPYAELYLLVLEEHRGQGLGSMLYAQAIEAAREMGFEGLKTVAYVDNAESTEWLAHRQFEQVELAVDVGLDITGDLPPATPLPDDVRVATLAERPELFEGYHAVLVQACEDIPGSETTTVPPADEFRTILENSPWYRPEACFLAIVDEDGAEAVVGLCELEFPAALDGIAWHGFTGVRRDHRGRHIARGLKAIAIQYAKDQGYRLLLTENEERNAPMRHINITLGFVPQPARGTYRRLLPSP